MTTKILLLCTIAVTLFTGCRTSPQALEAKYLQRGKAQMAKKDFNRAILEFRNATNAMPKDSEPYYQLGLAYLSAGLESSAAPAFHKCLELNPKHAGAQLKMAEFMASTRNQGLVNQAADLLHSVLEASPENTEAIDAMAITELELGKAEDAQKRLENALQKFPSDLQSAVMLARVKLRRRDLAGAESVLLRATQAAPQSAAAATALAELYVMDKQPDKAEYEVRRALQLEPKNPSALLRLAGLQLAGHRTEEAEHTFRQIAALPESRFRPAHAMFLYYTGKRKEAVADLETLLKKEPGDPNVRTRLVETYLGTNRLQQANEVLRAALKKNSKDLDALTQQSEVDLRTGKITEASQDLKQVIGIIPNSARPHYVMAAVYRAQRLPHDEQLELNQALRYNPGLLPARLRLARSYLELNAPSAAVATLNQAPAAQKQLMSWIVEKGWALLQAGDNKELRTFLNSVLAVVRSPELLVQDATLRMREKDYGGARADCEQVLEHNPDEIRAAHLMVDSYMAQKQPEKAAERLAELASAHPKSAALQQIQGEWCVSTGKLAEARKAFESAKAAAPKFAQAELSLAQLDLLEKNAAGARQRLNALVAADPQNLSALLLLANLDDIADDPTSATAHYRAVLTLDPSNLAALNNLANLLGQIDPDEALGLAQQAEQIAPDSVPVADTLGWIYYRKGVYGTAVQYFKTAVAKQPTPRLEFHLAMGYLKEGHSDLGRKLMMTALQADPNLSKTEHGW